MISVILAGWELSQLICIILKHDRRWVLSSVPIITANWEANSGNQWTIPFGGGVGKIFKIGKQDMNAQVQSFYKVDKPDNVPNWALWRQFQFISPIPETGD